MKKIWVLAADNTRARVFATDKRNGELAELFDLVNPKARLRERDFTSDLSGRTANSATGMTHSYGPDEKHKPRATEDFAREVARRLNGARIKGEFGRLYIVADPSFLGLLRSTLDYDTRKLVTGEVDKNLARGSVEQVRATLPDFL